MKLIGLLLLALVSLVEGEEIANSRRGVPSFAFPAFFGRSCASSFPQSHTEEGEELRVKFPTIPHWGRGGAARQVSHNPTLGKGRSCASFTATCPDFFVKDRNTPVTPTVFRGAQFVQICQKYKNVYRYATLYDTRNRIPVYSAYTYAGYAQTTRSGSWMIEPQLDDPRAQPEMGTEGKVPGDSLGAHQAVNRDYENTGYQKGHVYPHCHNCDKDQAESTFTLTNAAPQTGADNTQWFNQVEKQVTADIGKGCKPNTFQGKVGLTPNVVKNRVNIPSYYWSAVCCEDNNKKFTSWGYVLQMNGYGSSTAALYPLNQLNSDLTNEYNAPFKVFGAIQGCS
ncbi:endonuclease domain-containing 1 protein-like [Alosa sapidissima]|uniref:endonuclease domain-containing 1 protein-like n=1 Tax=Alosa sapidissima TaxID=34773 RepID=UPI001C09376C|nr:endonuclease domain-containing 1 protein-like [Alosa sapidissima]